MHLLEVYEIWAIKRLLSKKYSSQLCRSHGHLIPEPNDRYTMMASLKQQQPPPSSQQQAKDIDRIDASQKFYSGDYNTIRQVAKDKEIMGRDWTIVRHDSIMLIPAIPWPPLRMICLCPRIMQLFWRMVR